MLSEGKGDQQWIAHVDAKFKSYQRLWERACVAWNEAHSRGDWAARQKAYAEEVLYLRAEMLANRDMLLPLEQRSARWDADYLAEARVETTSLHY